MLSIATWNINSLRVRLAQLLTWLNKHQPDIMTLQETKVTDDQFPLEVFTQLGYHTIYAGQKTFNGVAILSREAPSDVMTDIAGLDDPQRRILIASIGKIRVINLYVPNGAAVDSEKYIYKLNWLKQVTTHIKMELTQHSQVVVLGDFNIAPADQDVHDPEKWRGNVLFSEPERLALQELLACGLKDTFRLFEQAPASFSWWDYRAAAFRRNHGLRIDHILASEALAAKCQLCQIDKAQRQLERPSDHAPVVAEFLD
ncbi:MAG: exodeoxyribonuclease III [Gammaproteobacteria bacterium]